MFTASFSGITDAGHAISTSWIVPHDHAALANAGRFTPQFDGHANLDDLVLRNPREIDMDDVCPPRVPLQFADERRLVDRPVRLTSRLPCRIAAVKISAATLSGTHSKP